MATSEATDARDAAGSDTPPIDGATSGMAAVGAAALLFRDELDLPFAPVPLRLAAEARVLGPVQIGTRGAEDGTAYDADWFLDDLAANPPDYFLLGHVGHGVNDWSIHYSLVLGPLALLVQIAWGGIYIDNIAAAERIGRAFALCQRLIESPPLERMAAGARLVVIDSDSAGSRWSVLAPGGEGGLIRHPDPLAAVLEWLEGEDPGAGAPADTRSWPLWG